MKNIKELVGKTISKAYIPTLKEYDDKPYLILEFTDGTKKVIVATYGGYTGESEAEYPCKVYVSDPENCELETK